MVRLELELSDTPGTDLGENSVVVELGLQLEVDVLLSAGHLLQSVPQLSLQSPSTPRSAVITITLHLLPRSFTAVSKHSSILFLW